MNSVIYLICAITLQCYHINGGLLTNLLEDVHERVEDVKVDIGGVLLGSKKSVNKITNSPVTVTADDITTTTPIVSSTIVSTTKNNVPTTTRVTTTTPEISSTTLEPATTVVSATAGISSTLGVETTTLSDGRASFGAGCIDGFKSTSDGRCLPVA